MNLKEIKELINLMNENGLIEIEVEREGTKIRIKKSASGAFESVTEEIPIYKKPRPPQIAPEKKEDKKIDNLVPVKSPMVGTFYRTPAPDAKPFVEAGSNVEAGAVLCIIEAMKLMNEIKSDVSGKIVEILAENGSSVEYGQVLFMIEP